MLNWAQQFNIFCFMDNQQYAVAPQRYECLLGAGAVAIASSRLSSWKGIDSFMNREQWTFGHITYDLGLKFYGLTPRKENKTGFPLFFFFQPSFLLYIRHNELIIENEEADKIYNEILCRGGNLPPPGNSVPMQSRLTKEDYCNKIRELQRHILRGDCYEVNFCLEFFSEGATVDPLAFFHHLVQVSPNPFSVFYKLEDKYLLCASPERFLHRKGNRLLSQPMKGTAVRNVFNKMEDDALKASLSNSAKDRSENVMIVDLVRNDLSKVCREGSVTVEELFGIYTYPQVHQMISTISGEVDQAVSFTSIMEAAFPMGSMTGAPKKRAMEIINEHEEGSRGIFSGSVGYIEPTGDFDFNVIIRSLMYNEANEYLSYQAGSGITFYSQPEKEWEECMVKGEAIKKVLMG
jgi:para-aminobenzoate synthetase component I